MGKLVFLDVDDTLLSPPYDAVRKVGRLLGKAFPPEEAFINRTQLHYYDAFPQLFSSAGQMWAMALLSLPFGYFRAHKALAGELSQMAALLRDHRVYLISKNPPVFTRWRVRRLAEIFGVQVGDRYIACGPIFGGGTSKLEIIQQLATDRQVALEDCLLVDDSADNVREALDAGVRAALVRSGWNLAACEELSARPSASVVDVANVADVGLRHLQSAVEPDATGLFFVPPWSPRSAWALTWYFVKRAYLYGERLPRMRQLVAIARNAWTSLLFMCPQAHVNDRLAALLQSRTTLVGARCVLLAKGGVQATLLPVDAAQQIEIAAKATKVTTLRRLCRDTFLRHGHRLVAKPLFYFTALHRNAEIGRILRAERVQQAVASYATSHQVSLSEAQAKAEKYAQQITGGRSYLGCYVTHLILNAVIKRTFHSVAVHRDDARIAELEKTHFLMYAAVHRSYLDSGILYAILGNYFSNYPFIVAADKMRGVWLGALGARAGAFFLKRKFVDGVYAAILAEHLSGMQYPGSSVEVFLEGQRSRSGLTLPPKKGIASIIWQNAISGGEGHGKVAIVPVSFAYNKLPESEMLIRESHWERQEKGVTSLREIADMRIKSQRKRTWVSRFRSTKRRLRHAPISECHVTFGTPIVLEPQTASPTASKEALRQYLNRAMFSINAVTPVLPSSVLCLALMYAPDHHLRREEAVAFLEVALLLVHLYQVPNGHRALRAKSCDAQVEDFLRLPFVNRKFKRHRLAETSILSLSELDVERASYYSNNVLHFFVLPAVLAGALNELQFGRIDEIHRFLDEVFERLANRYFLPPVHNFPRFVGNLLRVFQQTGAISTNEINYVVNTQGSQFAPLRLLAALGANLANDDLLEVYDNIRRSGQRVFVQLPVYVQSVTRVLPHVEMQSLSETDTFLRCQESLHKGDKVQFRLANNIQAGFTGLVVNEEIDGATVHISARHAPTPQGDTPTAQGSASGSLMLSRELKTEAKIKSLSASGAFVTIKSPLRVNDRISGSIQLEHAPISFVGRVVRTSEAGVAVRFEEMDRKSEAQLMLMVCGGAADKTVMS